MRMIIFLLLLLSFFLQATEFQENICAQAHKLYYDYAFKDALSAYISMSEKNSAVWENMGNCAYYLNDFPHAILYWRKAQQKADTRRFTYLQERIQQSYNQLGIEYQKSWQVYVGILPFWLLPLLFLFTWSLLLFCGPIYYRRNRRSRIIALLGISFFCGILYGIQYQYMQQKTGIVISSHSALHTGTDDKLPVVTQLKAGQEMKVSDKESDWFQASLGSYTGWIHKDMIEII